MARSWLYERRILIPRLRRLADWACDAFAVAESRTLAKIRSLKELEVHQWPLDGVALAKRQAYAAHVQLRRSSMTLRIERNRQDLEIICFLRVALAWPSRTIGCAALGQHTSGTSIFRGAFSFTLGPYAHVLFQRRPGWHPSSR